MMQVIPKWKVTVTVSDRREFTLWIYEAHASNVLRKVADLQFTENGLDIITSITIVLCAPVANHQTGVVSSTSPALR